MNDHMYMVLPPDINNIEDLELWKSKYDSMTYYQRKVSNDISIDQFGEDNITRYNKLKTKLLDKIDPNLNLGDINPRDTSFEIEDIMKSLYEGSSNIEFQSNTEDKSYSDKMLKVKKAESEGLVIMIDTEYGFSDVDYPEESIAKLKEKWNRFQSLSADKRQLSNDTAKDILGVDNYTLYDMILNRHIKEIETDEESPKEYSYYQDIIDANNIAPYYTAGDDTGFKSSDPIEESGGIYQWSKELESLYLELNNTPSYNKEKINTIKESIEKLGWNSEIPFSLEVASKTWVRENVFFSNIEVLDMTNVYLKEAARPVLEKVPKNLSYEKLKDKIVPVFVTLISGTGFNSKAIKWFTDSQWSHAAIGFDSSLEILYSFNLYRQGLNIVNGFSIEGKNHYLKENKDIRIKVYALFVTPEQRKNMLDAVTWYIENQDKTRYNFGNIFNIAMRKIMTKHAEDRDKMICSQFVYSILRLADFKMRKTKSGNFVSPADIDELSNDARFYCMYDGPLKDYRSGVVDNLIKKIIVTLPMEQYGIDESTGNAMINLIVKSSIEKMNPIDKLFIEAELMKK